MYFSLNNDKQTDSIIKKIIDIAENDNVKYQISRYSSLTFVTINYIGYIECNRKLLNILSNRRNDVIIEIPLQIINTIYSL